MSAPAFKTVAKTGSTNADMLAALRNGEAVREGEWLVADRQIAGKGRQGRTWSDGAGNFMGSTVVKPSPRDPAAQTLALVAGLALYESVVPLLTNPQSAKLKWPNDLLLRGAKLAGILLEREGEAVVVGIGVNLASAPDLPDKETIALSAIGPAPDRDSFAASLANSFAIELARWRNYGLDPIIRRWTVAAHPLGTAMTVHEPGGGLASGAFAGLSEDGSLRLRLADGIVRVIHAGDVNLG